MLSFILLDIKTAFWSNFIHWVLCIFVKILWGFSTMNKTFYSKVNSLNSTYCILPFAMIATYWFRIKADNFQGIELFLSLRASNNFPRCWLLVCCACISQWLIYIGFIVYMCIWSKSSSKKQFITVVCQFKFFCYCIRTKYK